MKIGINGWFLSQEMTGIGQVSVNFLDALQESLGARNEQVVVFTRDKQAAEKWRAATGRIEYVYVKPWWPRKDLVQKYVWEKCQLPRVLKQLQCTSLFSLYQSVTVVEGVRHVMLVHDVVPEIYPEAYQSNLRTRFVWQKTKEAIGQATKLITVSESSRKDLVRYLDLKTESIDVALLGVPTLLADSPEEAVPGINEAFFYHGGGLEVRKNTQAVIDAYRCFLDQAPDRQTTPKLVISGKLHATNNPLAFDVVGYREQHALTDKVWLCGEVSTGQLHWLYRHATLFVYPSLYEGFGLPVLEAMSCGCPVIATEMSSVPEVCGDACILVAPEDVRVIAEAMSNVLATPSLREALVRRSQKRAEQFSWQTLVISFWNNQDR